MHEVRVSTEAGQDIDEITGHTLEKWGWRQTARYLDRLEATLEILARNPSIGRLCQGVHPGLRRFEVAQHVVFYTVEEHGIFIVRVLHERMLPANYI
ncbi:MAG: type II toxin-antitoxin system RelE/ParE family toxin [Terracidiphilus sp.]